MFCPFPHFIQQSKPPNNTTFPPHSIPFPRLEIECVIFIIFLYFTLMTLTNIDAIIHSNKPPFKTFFRENNDLYLLIFFVPFDKTQLIFDGRL